MFVFGQGNKGMMPLQLQHSLEVTQSLVLVKQILGNTKLWQHHG